MDKYRKIMDMYINNDDIARNNANMMRSVSALEGVVVGEIMKDYLFDEITKDIPIRQIHEEGWAYLHQAFRVSAYCVGLSGKDIAMFGLQSNAKNTFKSDPPKRLDTLFAQSSNLICLIAQEVSGATSLNDISTIAASYLYILETQQNKTITDYDIKNHWQGFLYNVNLPFRSSNSPFSNITLEFGKPNPHLAEEYVVYAGKILDFKYKDIPEEYYNRIVNGFIDAMYDGDGSGNVFSFPLITVNLYDDFDWDNPIFKKLLEKSEYFGGLYFQNYMSKPFTQDSIYKQKNKFIEPFDIGMIYSNCCIAPDQEIIYIEENESKSIKIIDFYKKFKGNLITKDDDEKESEWYSLNSDVYVPSLNIKTGNIENKKVTKILKVKSNTELTFKFSNDKILKCEPTHIFITFEDGKYVKKMAKDINIGETVPFYINNETTEYLSVVDIDKKINNEKIDFYDIEVEDNHTFILTNGLITHNCRMTFNIDDVLKYTGSNPFHSNSGVGGIGVYNINMNRILYLAGKDFEAFKKLFDYIYDVGVKVLVRKREFIKKHWSDLYPYFSYYQKRDNSLFNIFSVVGTHEGLINAGFKDGIKSEEGKEYGIKLATYIREKIENSIEKYNQLFSLEYAPSENAACRLAEKDILFSRKVKMYLNNKSNVYFSRDEYLNNVSKELVENNFTTGD